jgi:FlgD Ig-like domain
MRSTLALLLLIIGATLLAPSPSGAFDFGGEVPQPKLMNAKIAGDLQSRASQLGASSTTVDTVFVGFTPGHTADNYWSIWSGSDKFHDGGPYHRPPARGGMWDFEGPYPHGDSLMGFTPHRVEMTGTGGLTIPDYNRPWRCIDFGNEASSIIPGVQRTHAVVGVWHVDRGKLQAVPASVNDAVDLTNGAGNGVGGVNWTPLVGSSSAWMGLRRHGDNSHIDDVSRGGTGNAFTEDVMNLKDLHGVVAQGGTDKRFPGYGYQMDQMLYRDVDVSGVGTLTVGFSYRTNMSTGFVTNNITRSGWFQWDPLTVITGGANPNFLASTGNPTPPVDSFMVYVGAPAESSVVLSDGAAHPIYDKQRRWLGEVIRGNEGLYTQIFSVGGTNAVTAISRTVSAAEIDRITASATAGVANKVRIVFRVKTNSGFDDESFSTTGYTSGGAGAAVVDQVTISKDGGAAAVVGAFESPAEINNSMDFGPYGNLAHANHPLNVWKATGKPPKVYSHIHPMAGDPERGYIPLVYQDICGQPGDPNRICNMDGVVMSVGDHDNFESSGGTFGTAEQEPFDGFWSPTINLTGQGHTTRIINGVVTPVNNMGLSAADADPTEDFYLDYEMYTGRFNIFTTGNGWRFQFMVFPAGNAASQTGQYKRWSMSRAPGFIYFNPDKQCFRNLDAAYGNGLIRTTNASGVPDSIRIEVYPRQEAYRFGIPVSENFDGAYFDNISLTIVDGAGSSPVSVDIWQLFQDTFPSNTNDGLVGYTAAFDTTTGLMKSGINVAPVTGNSSRFNVPGDTTVVIAEGDNVRVDMVFRILPGPGNYTNPGATTNIQRLKRVPNSGIPITGAVSGSANFWENYMANRGAKGAGSHASPLWSPQVWHSARMDTAEINVFQLQKRIAPQPADVGLFMAAYHEDELVDPVRRALAIPRNICFIADTATSVSTQTVICGSGSVPAGASYPPAWAFAASAGLATAGSGNPLASPSQIHSCPGPAGSGLCQTLEGTKILPDGMFTPGTHITYFFRREDLPPSTPSTYLMPDTNVVTPQPGEGSLDQHRWQEVSVLPDRWKDSDYTHPVLGTPGTGEACVLFVDNNDRRGNEAVFMSIADTIAMNAANKRGGSNGWSSRGDVDVNDPTGFVRRHVGQAGTTFDKYDIKASESLSTNTGSIGSRSAFTNPANTQVNGKRSFQGPSPTMLTTFYKVLFTVTGDLNSSLWGPFNNKSSNDVGIMTQFATSGDPSDPNRGLYTVGNGWNEAATGPAFTFVTQILGADLTSVNYIEESGNTSLSVDVHPTAALPTAFGSRYGVGNGCTSTLDVLIPVLPEATASTVYDDPNNNGPHEAGILKTHTALNPWIALSDGWDIEALTSPDGGSSRGRLHYYLHALNDAFATIAGCNVVGQPTMITDTPHTNGRLFNFMSLRNNPVRTGYTTFAIGLAQSDRVKIQIFDVAGRLVRTLADRNFTAGEHALIWDGADNAGKQASRGVYFAKLEYANQGFTSKGKLVLLK